MRLLRLAPFAILAGCIASASAQDPDHDVLTLTSGERLVGELVDVRDGRYWVLLTDGRMVSVEFRTVSRVDMANGSTETVAPNELPLPKWSEATQHEKFVGKGFDFGLVQGGRIRLNFDTPGVAHVDLKLGLSVMVASGLGFGPLTGGEVAFFGDSPVHLTLGAAVGFGIIYGSFYPIVGGTAGVQFDPKGPMEVHVGALVGTSFSSFALAPDLSVSWVW